MDLQREEQDPAYRLRIEAYRGAIRRNGFHLVLKEVKRYRNPEGEEVMKASSDLELAVDAVLQPENLDYILLGTGDVDLTAGVDVMARFRTMPLFIECKRPSSQKKIVENLDGASGQIMKELGQTLLASYGIPAISMTKARWRGWPLVRGASMESIRASLTTQVAQFDQDYITPWFRRQTDDRMVAVLVHFPYVAYMGDSSTILGTELRLIGSRFLQGTLAYRDLADLVKTLGVIH